MTSSSTFCVVPYTRGAESSRDPVAAVEADAPRLARGGVRELTLLGPNVNAYGGFRPGRRAWSLAQLIDRLADIEAVKRLRLSTSHPPRVAERSDRGASPTRRS